MICRWVFISLGLFSFSQIQADNFTAEKIKKNYISSEMIRLENDSILVFLNHQWVQTPALYSDSCGMYVDEIKFLPWQCSNCGRWTTGWFCCEYCGEVADKSLF